MVKIKICGLRLQEDVQMVNLVLPDHVGFIFAPSTRRIGVEGAKLLKQSLNPLINTVGVFVNEDLKNIIKICDLGIIDTIQLHGDEDRKYINDLKGFTDKKIIKAFRIKNEESFHNIDSIGFDYFLFDTFSKGQYGGTGKTFDWSLIPDLPLPYFLAGGINSSNIIKACEQCRPYGIDVSSGVETKGNKDYQKIIEIMTKIIEI